MTTKTPTAQDCWDGMMSHAADSHGFKRWGFLWRDVDALRFIALTAYEASLDRVWMYRFETCAAIQATFFRPTDDFGLEVDDPAMLYDYLFNREMDHAALQELRDLGKQNQPRALECSKQEEAWRNSR